MSTENDEPIFVNENYIKRFDKVRFVTPSEIYEFMEKETSNKNEIGNLMLNSKLSKPKKSHKFSEEFMLSELKIMKENSLKKEPNFSHQKSTNALDKEIEEDINDQIFGYTKRMKENAKFFGERLKQDNETLNKIETIQSLDLDKTKKETKKLMDFNFSLKLGLCKILMMMMTVIGMFMVTLLIMRIFPKVS